MNIIKLFEDFNKIEIPDELAKWCIELHGSQPCKPYDVTNIPQEIIFETKKLVDNSEGKIWRGFGLWDELHINNRNLNSDNTRTFKYDWGASWSYNKEIALGFAESRIEEEQYGYLAEYDIDKLTYPMSMCIIIENLTRKQLLDNYWDLKYYHTEYEIIVLEELKIPLENIKLICSPE
jgi:hypothetical protein